MNRDHTAYEATSNEQEHPKLTRRSAASLVLGGGTTLLGLLAACSREAPESTRPAREIVRPAASSVYDIPSTYPGGMPVGVAETFELRDADGGVYPVETDLSFGLAVFGGDMYTRVLFRLLGRKVSAVVSDRTYEVVSAGTFHAARVLDLTLQSLQVPLLSGRVRFSESGTYQVLVKNADSPMAHVTWVMIGE